METTFQKINLEEYDLLPYDPTSDLPVCTRDGKSVRVLCTDRAGIAFHIVALIMHEGIESIETFSNSGRLNSRVTTNNDLFNYKPKSQVRFWYNVYCRSGGGIILGDAYTSEKEAKEQSFANDQYLETLSYTVNAETL